MGGRATPTATGSRTPVVVVTGFPDDRLRERALGAGAVCFLGKPFDTREFC